ncbi:MAG: DUF1127 domain-containing protein [Rhodospirillales bacterium]|nr:DUF1127 domain-containing protein [Rhodospirillales bacterium]
MSGNICELQPEITQDQINAGIRRAHILRSRYFSTLLSGRFRKGIEAIAAMSRRRNQSRHLADLPDYLLKDIGISRDRIESLVSGALRRDSLSLSPTGSPSSQPAFWRGAPGRSSVATMTPNKLAA